MDLAGLSGTRDGQIATRYITHKQARRNLARIERRFIPVGFDSTNPCLEYQSGVSRMKGEKKKIVRLPSTEAICTPAR